MQAPTRMAWVLALAVTCGGSHAATEQDALVLLSNPLSDLDRFSADFDSDHDLGPEGDVERDTLALQPVFSVPVSAAWRVVSRTRLPIVDTGGHSGLGDLYETLFVTPRERSEIAWAIGSTVRFDTASVPELSAGGWGAGPALALVQREKADVSGLMIARVWPLERGSGDVWRLEGFTTWNRDGVGVSLELDAQYDTQTRETTCPISIGVSRVVRSGALFVNIGARARYFVDVPVDKGPWGLGITLTLVNAFEGR